MVKLLLKAMLIATAVLVVAIALSFTMPARDLQCWEGECWHQNDGSFAAECYNGKRECPKNILGPPPVLASCSTLAGCKAEAVTSQLFFSCVGNMADTYQAEGRNFSRNEKVIASLMLDLTKQKVSFRPSNDIAPLIYDDEAHPYIKAEHAAKLTCPFINQSHQQHRQQWTIAEFYSFACGDVWSDDTSLSFAYDRTWDDPHQKQSERWKGRLDRVTGQLEIEEFSNTTRERKDGQDFWSNIKWTMICKKVESLIDEKPILSPPYEETEKQGDDPETVKRKREQWLKRTHDRTTPYGK